MIAFHGLGEITVHPGVQYTVHTDNLIQLDHEKISLGTTTNFYAAC